MNKEYAYSYNIRPETDEKAFKKICKIIESKLKGIEKEKLLIDVDGTLIQIYYFYGEKIAVYDDYDVDAVYIDSDVDLEDVLGLKSIW